MIKNSYITLIILIIMYQFYLDCVNKFNLNTETSNENNKNEKYYILEIIYN